MLRHIFVLLILLTIWASFLGQEAPALAAPTLQTTCAISLGAVLEAPFCDPYSMTDIGSVPGLPPRYGGLTFLLGDPNTILIGGNANEATGKRYAIQVVHDANHHITS